MGSSTKTIRYVYDSLGNRKALIDHDGGRTTYVYDNVNRLKSVENAQNQRTTYSYDAGGRRTLKELANGTRASFSYDPAGNLTGLYNLKSGGTVISSFDYAYDRVGNRTAVLEADGSRVTWSYDNVYQLTGEHRTGTSPYRDTYTYDPAGNRLLKNHDGARTTYAYDAANQLTYSQDASGRTTYTFDADGNQQVVRAPSGDRTTYVWDYENRMTSVQQPSGIRNTMAYDADGLRVKLEESTGTKKFLWDDQNYLAETDATNDTQVVYTNEPQQYGNLISQRQGSDSHWCHFDAIGSTRGLTDVNQVLADVLLFTAWGETILQSGSDECRLAFIGLLGYYVDPDSGFIYIRERFFNPSPGRWGSTDVLGASSAEPNLYRYVHNRPIRFTDPSGRYEFMACCDYTYLCSCGADSFWNTGKKTYVCDAGTVRATAQDCCDHALPKTYVYTLEIPWAFDVNYTCVRYYPTGVATGNLGHCDPGGGCSGEVRKYGSKLPGGNLGEITFACHEMCACIYKPDQNAIRNCQQQWCPW